MKSLCIFLFTTFCISTTYAQVGINTDDSAPHSSAVLDVKSTTKAFYPPRMTTAEKDAIVGKQVGAVVFDVTLNQLSVYNGSTWVSASGGGFTLPYIGTAAVGNNGYVLDIANTTGSDGTAIIGRNSTVISGEGIFGTATATSPLSNSVAGVYGRSGSTNSLGVGVRAFHAGTGPAFFGSTANGVGARLSSTNGFAIQSQGKLQFAGNGVGILGASKFLKSINANGDAEWADLLPYTINKYFDSDIPLSITNTSPNSSGIYVYAGNVNYSFGNSAVGIHATGGREGIYAEAIGNISYIDTYGLKGVNNNSSGANSSYSAGVGGFHNFGGNGVTGRANNNGIGVLGIGNSDGNSFSNYISVHTKGIGVLGMGQIGIEGETDHFGDLATDVAVVGSAVNGIGARFRSTNGYGLLVTSGNVGIGTAEPEAILDIRSSNYNTPSLFYYGANEDTYIRGGKAGSHVLINDVDGYGNVGIGVNNPAFILDIKDRIRLRANGSNSAGIYLNNNANTTWNSFIGVKTDTQTGIFIGGNWRFWVDNTGAGYLNGNLIQTSDKRLKKDFTQLNNSLINIYKLNGYHFRWIEEARNKDLQTGFIAQEVQKIFPELVQTDDKGFLSVNYIGLIPHLIEAVKELKKENAELKANDKNLISRLQKLEDILNVSARK